MEEAPPLRKRDELMLRTITKVIRVENFQFIHIGNVTELIFSKKNVKYLSLGVA